MNDAPPRQDDDDALAAAFGAIALSAGRAILDVRDAGIAARHKSDSSPVTDADEQAERIILEHLRRLAPGIPVIAEESFSGDGGVGAGGPFILVDPLDGTREFVGGHDDFTVNIALVRGGAPVVGAVYAPALGRLWIGARDCFAIEAAAGAPMPPRAQWRAAHTRKAEAGALVALISRSHLDDRAVAELARLDVAERRPMGSSLKFCVLAEGRADVYPRFGPTMEWDTAAGDAVLRAAGGAVLGEDGEPLKYGQPGRGFRNGGFMAWGDPGMAARA